MKKKTLDKNSDQPLYIQIKEILRVDVLSNENSGNLRLPSERQLAKTFGVSRMTARQALKKLGEELVLEQTVGRGTFFTGETCDLTSIRFVFPNNWASLSRNTFYSNIFAAAEQKAQDYDCDLVFSTLDKKHNLISRLDSTDAVVLVGEADFDVVQRVHATDCRLCLLDSEDGGSNLGWDKVDIDNKQGSEIAADMFIKSRHQKCAFIGPQSRTTSFAYRRREKYFGDFLHSHGLKFDKKHVFKMPYYEGSDGIVEAAHALMDKLIAGSFTAVYAGHSGFAVGLLEYLKKHNLDQDISIIGFGDNQVCQQASLSVIGTMESQAGELAIELIVNSFNNGYSLKQETMASTYFIDRGSIHSL